MVKFSCIYTHYREILAYVVRFMSSKVLFFNLKCLGFRNLYFMLFFYNIKCVFLNKINIVILVQPSMSSSDLLYIFCYVCPMEFNCHQCK